MWNGWVSHCVWAEFFLLTSIQQFHQSARHHPEKDWKHVLDWSSSPPRIKTSLLEISRTYGACHNSDCCYSCETFLSIVKWYKTSKVLHKQTKNNKANGMWHFPAVLSKIFRLNSENQPHNIGEVWIQLWAMFLRYLTKRRLFIHYHADNLMKLSASLYNSLDAYWGQFRDDYTWTNASFLILSIACCDSVNGAVYNMLVV